MWHVVTGRGVGVKGYFLGYSSWPPNFKGSPAAKNWEKWQPLGGVARAGTQTAAA